MSTFSTFVLSEFAPAVPKRNVSPLAWDTNADNSASAVDSSSLETMVWQGQHPSVKCPLAVLPNSQPLQIGYFLAGSSRHLKQKGVC